MPKHPQLAPPRCPSSPPRLRLSPDSLWRKLISAASIFFQSLLGARDDSWGSERRLICKFYCKSESFAFWLNSHFTIVDQYLTSISCRHDEHRQPCERSPEKLPQERRRETWPTVWHINKKDSQDLFFDWKAQESSPLDDPGKLQRESRDPELLSAPTTTISSEGTILV